MNAAHQARSAYVSTKAAVPSSPRHAEAGALRRLSRQLRSAEAEGFVDLAEAVHATRRLWVALSIDLCAPSNGLPEALRADLIGIGAFVDRHCREVLRRRATVGAIVEINDAVAAGLEPMLPSQAAVTHQAELA